MFNISIFCRFSLEDSPTDRKLYILDALPLAVTLHDDAFKYKCENPVSFVCKYNNPLSLVPPQALVWAIAERLRQIEVRHSSHDFAGAPPSSVPASNGDADVAILGVGSGGGELRGNNAESLKLAVALGDALAQSFLRRPSVRFLETLRCITKELATFDRCGIAGK